MTSFRMIRFKLTTQLIYLVTAQTLRIKHQLSNRKCIGCINYFMEAMKVFFLSKLKTNSICKIFAHCQCHPGVVMISMITLQRPDRSTLCWSLLLKQHRQTEAVMNFLWPRRCQFSNHLPDQGQNIAAIAFAHPNDLNHYEIKWNLTRPPILKLNVSIKKELCTIFINKLHVCNLWPKQFLFSVNFNSCLSPPFQKWPFNWVESFTSLRCDMMTSVVVTCSHMSATLVCLVNNIPIITTFTIHHFFFPKEAR